MLVRYLCSCLFSQLFLAMTYLRRCMLTVPEACDYSSDNELR
jgi:hypothetical protein